MGMIISLRIIKENVKDCKRNINEYFVNMFNFSQRIQDIVVIPEYGEKYILWYIIIFAFSPLFGSVLPAGCGVSAARSLPSSSHFGVNFAPFFDRICK